MRILGVTIPDNKSVNVALTYIYGVGPVVSGNILKNSGIKPTKKAKELTAEETNKIISYIEKHVPVEGNLRQQVRRNIQILKEIGSYRGSRHARRLPVHGQRTKTNSRTVRGNVRKTAGSGKRKVDLK